MWGGGGRWEGGLTSQCLPGSPGLQESPTPQSEPEWPREFGKAHNRMLAFWGFKIQAVNLEAVWPWDSHPPSLICSEELAQYSVP